MTRVTLTPVLNSNIKLGPPFSRVPGNVESIRTSPPGPPEGLLRAPDLIPPLWAIIVKLVSRITPSPLNRFPRFQLRCISLKISFQRYIKRPDTSRGSREKACKQKNGNFRFSSPRTDMEIRIPPSES